jgi:CubicO group peptidase (beta-lactamase class C family)
MGKLRHTGEGGDLMPNSLRRIASVTKVFTTIAIMRLVEDGKIHLVQKVSSIIDEFDTDMHRDIRIFHLLTHTSGLQADPGFFLEPYTAQWWQLVEAGKKSWIEAVLSGPVQSKPGQVWSYSSSGFAVLGEIISRVSGMYAEDYVRQTLIDPLGMDRTFYDVPPKLHDQVCITNDWGEEDLTKEHTKEDQAKWPPRVTGGLYASLHDLWKLGQMLLDKGTLNEARILGRKTVEAMTRNQLRPKTPAFYWGDRIVAKQYGLGFDVYERPDLMSWNRELLSPGSFSHEGAGRSGVYIDPVEGLVFVYFTPVTDVDWIPEAVVNPLSVIWSGLI